MAALRIQIKRLAETLECIDKLDELLQDTVDNVALFRAITVKLKEKLKGWISKFERQLTTPVKNQLNPEATTAPVAVDKDALSGVKLNGINNSKEQLLQDLVDNQDSTDGVRTQIQQNIKSTVPSTYIMQGNPFQRPTGTTVKPPILSQPKTESVPNHIHEALIDTGACGLDEKTVTYSKNLPLATNLQNRSSSYGPIGIFWDMDSCDVPSNVGECAAVNVKEDLRKHPEINGAVSLFNGYGDTNCCPRHIRLAYRHTGVSLIVVPNGRKEAVYKTILRDMFMCL
ncbi:hypothetical protein SLA2020_168190 [Shorea laevis]